LPTDQFVTLLDDITNRFQRVLHLVDRSNPDTFDSVLEQVIDAFTLKVR